MVIPMVIGCCSAILIRPCLREYNAGKGDKEVEEGSQVTINLVGRLLNLNGVKFFSTKEKTDEFGEGQPLTFTIGAGEALPGLEEGMIGMKKGAIRKVCLTEKLAYTKPYWRITRRRPTGNSRSVPPFRYGHQM